MGTLIKMVSVAHPRFRFYPGNSIDLSARTATQCLDNAGVDPHELAILINTGIYRHKNTGEPAIAALIQERIAVKKHSGYDHRISNSTFSFDLNNGGCGLLTGIEIAGEVLNDSEKSYGMVVTGDSKPFHRQSDKFIFNSASAALILSKSEYCRGFTMFRTYTFPEYSGEMISYIAFTKPDRNRRGKNILYISQSESYSDLCVDLAAKSLFDFLEETGKSLREIDLIIPSQSPLKFTGKLKARLGMNENFVEISQNGEKTFHTAGPAFALKKAWDDDRFKSAKNIIFLTIGSGINVTLALYCN